jgi:hypothetical protein
MGVARSALEETTRTCDRKINQPLAMLEMVMVIALAADRPERMEEPGKPRTRLSIRGPGTQNRTDPVLVSATKTRLFDPTLNFLGTNDNPGDYRSSGCSACREAVMLSRLKPA